MAWERKKAGGACSLCFDAAHPWFQIHAWLLWLVRSLTVGKWVINNTCMCVNVIKANAFKHKKHRNLTGLITLTFHIKMCYRIIASGPISGVKTINSTGSPFFFSLPGHVRLALLADFLFHSVQLGSLFAGYWKKGLQYYMYYYIVIVIAVFISLQSSSD